MKKLAIIILAVLLIPMIAQAQKQGSKKCLPRDELVEALESRFGERPREVGMISNKAIMEVFRSEETGTFTVVATNTDYVSCIIAAGKNWLLRELPIEGDPV